MSKSKYTAEQKRLMRHALEDIADVQGEKAATKAMALFIEMEKHPKRFNDDGSLRKALSISFTAFMSTMFVLIDKDASIQKRALHFAELAVALDDLNDVLRDIKRVKNRVAQDKDQEKRVAKHTAELHAKVAEQTKDWPVDPTTGEKVAPKGWQFVEPTDEDNLVK